MFPRHYIAHCARCNEITPHEDHSLGRRIAIGLGLVGIVVVLCLGSLRSWAAVGLLIYTGLWFGLDRHERHVNEQCTRCRHKWFKAWRKTQPDLRNSTIDPF